MVSNRIPAIPAGINMHDVKENKRILRRRNEARKGDEEERERRRIALLFHPFLACREKGKKGKRL